MAETSDAPLPETRKRFRSTTITPEEKKRRRLERVRKQQKTKIMLGKEYDRWQAAKQERSMKTDREFAVFLLNQLLNSGGGGGKSQRLKKHVLMRNVGTQCRTLLKVEQGCQTFLDRQDIDAACHWFSDAMSEGEGEDEEKENNVVTSKRWRCLKNSLGCSLDTELAKLLLDWYVKTSPRMKTSVESLTTEQMEAADASIRDTENESDPYLLTMKVTRDQELAIHTFCTLRGWNYDPKELLDLTEESEETSQKKWTRVPPIGQSINPDRLLIPKRESAPIRRIPPSSFCLGSEQNLSHSSRMPSLDSSLDPQTTPVASRNPLPIKLPLPPQEQSLRHKLKASISKVSNSQMTVQSLERPMLVFPTSQRQPSFMVPGLPYTFGDSQKMPVLTRLYQPKIMLSSLVPPGVGSSALTTTSTSADEVSTETSLQDVKPMLGQCTSTAQKSDTKSDNLTLGHGNVQLTGQSSPVTTMINSRNTLHDYNSESPINLSMVRHPSTQSRTAVLLSQQKTEVSEPPEKVKASCTSENSVLQTSAPNALLSPLVSSENVLTVKEEVEDMEYNTCN